MSGYATLAEAIARCGQDYPNAGFTFQDMKGRETSWPYPRISEETLRRAIALRELGVRKGDRVAMAIIEPEEFVLTFLAATRLGAWPVPLYPPLSMAALDAYAERTARILSSAEARLLIVSSKLTMLLWELVDRVPSLERVIAAGDLARAPGADTAPLVEVTPEDVAFLQFTSGSTALPKGVMVTHGSIAANTKAIIRDRYDLEPERDLCLAWLPLYHDMGLIGFVISTLMHGLPVMLMPPVRFLVKPSSWIEAMHQHRAAVSFAPNFAFALATRRTKPEKADQWDLSGVKLMGCGAEPIQAGTLAAFSEFFGEHCGYDAGAFSPSYGMAEATLAMSLHDRGAGVVTHRVDRERFENEGVVELTDAGDAIEHVDCGPAHPDHAFQIIDDQGQPLPEGRQGQICFSGPSLTAGYFRNEQATAETFVDGWLRTGDLGYLLGGHVFVTGRIKDLIIFNGRNIHPQVIEWAAAEVDGVRKGNVVAFSRPGASSEELVLVAETSGEPGPDLAKAVRAAVQTEAGAPLTDVVFVPKGSLPKTSSGKLQRRETRARYLAGTIGQGTRTPGAKADGVTVARHVARSVLSRARSVIKKK